MHRDHGQENPMLLFVPQNNAENHFHLCTNFMCCIFILFGKISLFILFSENLLKISQVFQMKNQLLEQEIFSFFVSQYDLE